MLHNGSCDHAWKCSTPSLPSFLLPPHCNKDNNNNGAMSMPPPGHHHTLGLPATPCDKNGTMQLGRWWAMPPLHDDRVPWAVPPPQCDSDDNDDILVVPTTTTLGPSPCLWCDVMMMMTCTGPCHCCSKTAMVTCPELCHHHHEMTWMTMITMSTCPGLCYHHHKMTTTMAPPVPPKWQWQHVTTTTTTASTTMAMA